jgi:pimeloyl-ACP methyl ester carboxylesterase
MLCQNWIVKGSSRVLTVNHWPDVPIPMGVVILLPGFSHSMCDMDYFMSRLARQLCSRGFFVVQADLRGHGDGAGDFSDINFETLEEDIKTLVEHYKSGISDQVFCVGRGLMATLLAAFAKDANITGIAGIGPYCMEPSTAQAVSARMEKDRFDAFEAFPGRDYVKFSDFSEDSLCMLNALGAVPYNIQGMEMSAQLLKDLASFNALHSLQNTKCNSLWLFPGKEKASTKAISFKQETAYPQKALFHRSPLPREPKTQLTFQTALTDWILDSAYKLN